MTDPSFRVFARVVGVVLVLLGGLVMWDALWISSGIDAFSGEYGDLLAQTVDRAKWKELRPDEPTPGSDRFLKLADGFFGARARRSGIVAFVSCELSGALLVLGSIPQRRKTRPA
jgi:hypothetical protein